MAKAMGVWFPAVKVGTGSDQYTVRLVAALNKRGIKAGITWLPRRAEYLPWTVPVPSPPEWATVVHVNSWLHWRFIPEGLPVVATLHSCVHDECLSPYKSLPQSLYHRYWILKLEQRVVSSASAVTAVSEYTARIGRQVFGRQDIVPLHNWIDADLFSPETNQITHKPFRLCFVGSMSMRKGKDVLVAIMKVLDGEVELYFTGDLVDLKKYAPLPNNLKAIGRISGDDELVEYYRDCDAILFPTRLEGFGLVALEAAACGKPVIASRNSSLPEIVSDERTGLLCETDNVAQFVSAIRRLRDDRELYNEMSLEARHYSIENFSEKNAVNAYIEIYQKALSRIMPS